jgi:hypothetical protein
MRPWARRHGRPWIGPWCPCSAAVRKWAPHERATLARPDMELGADADLRYGHEHAQSYREASSGGGFVKVGGCGWG